MLDQSKDLHRHRRDNGREITGEDPYPRRRPIKINEKELLEIKQKRNEMSKLLYRKRNNVIEFIHDFWKTAFLGHTYLRNLLSEEDQEVFKYFSSLEVENHEDVKSGYSITFNFNPNCYFSDTKIVKTFTFNEEGTTKITATPIQWRRGKEIPKRQKKKKGTSCLLPIKG
ncbi:NAP1-related protein [Trifolium repens]|nr:NAP1-related protein [Trifolium repens]